MNSYRRRIYANQTLPLAIAAVWALAMPGQAAATVPATPLDLTHATVFLRGAELFSSKTLMLPAGEHELLLTNVAGRIDPQSLSIAVDNGVKVLSSGVRENYLQEEALSPQAQRVRDELEKTRSEREGMQIQLNVIEEQLNVLQANRQLAQKDGQVTAAQVATMLDLVSSRMSAALQRRARITPETAKLDERIKRLEQQLAEEKGKGLQPGGQVLVRLYAPKATTAQVRMSYVVEDAGWVPAYDLDVAEIGKPVSVTYKADIFQNTGIDWNRVNLTLSTSNPSRGAQAPVLRPRYLTTADNSGVRGRMQLDRVMEGSAASPSMTVAQAPAERVRGNTLEGYVTTNAQGIDTRYQIAIPYTVPSDGKGHMVLIENSQVPATYQYVVMPALDREAFLQARLGGWQNLNLLPGKTNVYFQNSFVGQGAITLSDIKDGLDLSLGRDKRIIVNRVRDQNDRSSSGVFGGNQQRTFAYTIHVRNTLTKPITLIVKEQLPVSQDSRITLAGLNLAGGEHNDKTGELAWPLELQSGGKHDLTYSYIVRYPKDMTVYGLD